MFLHGYLSSKKSFYKQIPFFERDFNVFALDLKGFGENSGMEYPYSLYDYLSEVEEYMYKNSITKPHVIAHSFGARIAVLGASEKPELFDRLVLTGAAGLKSRFSLKKSARKLEYKFLKNFLPKEKLTRFFSSDYNSLPPVMKESFCKIVSFNLDGKLCKIQNRTLLVFGKNDKETPPYMAERYKKGIKNSQLVYFSDAGHFCFLDRPNDFNYTVKEFLLL